MATVPGQRFVKGVTVYVTVPEVVALLISCWAMVDPDPGPHPVTLVGPTAVQVKTVPEAFEDNPIFVVVPEQIVVGDGEEKITVELGLTYTRE